MKRGLRGLIFFGFISLQELLGIINCVNISAHTHCRYANMVQERDPINTSEHSHFTLQICMYRGRNDMGFISKGIGIIVKSHKNKSWQVLNFSWFFKNNVMNFLSTYVSLFHVIKNSYSSNKDSQLDFSRYFPKANFLFAIYL